MAGLFGLLQSSAGAMEVLRRALDVSQNNVNNASTPGYVRQRLAIQALPFRPDIGLSGGVAAGSVQSARSEYSETAVRERRHHAGYASQQAQQAAAIEPAFDVSGEAGIPGAMNALFKAISRLSATPDDATAQNDFFAQAGGVVRSFSSTAASLASASAQAEGEIRDVLRHISALAGQVQDYNSQVRHNATLASDPGADAAIHGTLEELAELVDCTVLKQEDGSFTVLAGGQTPLVIGDDAFDLAYELDAGGLVIRDSGGRDATAQLTSGRLGAILEFHNATLPGWLERLNSLAADLGGRVNEVMEAPVFSWRAEDSAASLTVDSQAALTSLDPAALAASAHSDAAAFTDAYSTLAADVGRTVERAGADADTRMLFLNQARQMRADLSGVSLDEEAAYLLELQRSYEAAARLVAIVDELTQATLDMVR